MIMPGDFVSINIDADTSFLLLFIPLSISNILPYLVAFFAVDEQKW
jgi:hypothetical protein